VSRATLLQSPGPGAIVAKDNESTPRMNFRAKKVLKIIQEQGPRRGASFLLRDIYYRIVHRMAFPTWRQKTAGVAPKEFDDFLLGVTGPGSSVLEIGSRGVSDTTARGFFNSTTRYVGMDIMAGPNVDIVGDAHELSHLFPKESFDGVFSRSVFEHLLMPWKVVLEINAVLKPGGLVYVLTHPTWPAHELPWDFWRFQPNSFWALFNRATGFELVSCTTFEPARLIPASTAIHLGGTVKTECPMGVVALARKIGPCDERLAWPVRVSEITSTMYPSREVECSDR
jgi:SAM-dependent methyltransferase